MYGAETHVPTAAGRYSVRRLQADLLGLNLSLSVIVSLAILAVVVAIISGLTMLPLALYKTAKTMRMIIMGMTSVACQHLYKRLYKEQRRT